MADTKTRVQDDGNRCPKCGSTLTYGYGLMGGGIGAYVLCDNDLCDNDLCDYFEKEQDGEE